MEKTAHYIGIVPNSHSFGGLENILVNYDLKPEELTKEYLLIGFRNTIKREYEIKQIGEPVNAGPIFPSIENIIKYIEQPDFNLKSFVGIIGNTLNNNIDLKGKRKMERTEVYKCLDTERDYQDLRWSPRNEINGVPDEEKPVAEWINYIEFHLSKAKENVYLLDTQAALAELRKVAALAVRCFELHGCPERIIPKEPLEQ